MRLALSLGITIGLAASATAQMRITEWAYQGGSGEFIEFTNVGGVAIDMTGWSYDDDSRTAGSVSLSAFGLVNPGASVVLTEVLAADFISAWSLNGVAVIGLNNNNLSRNDEINLFDNASQLVDRLTYGDQNIPGTIRTQNVAGIPSSAAALGANSVALWQLAVNGDAFGSRISLHGDVGNPGVYVPEPATLALLAFGGLFALRRR